MAGPALAFQTGDHSSRPAASAGCVLYSCTDHNLVYRSDGSSWATLITLVSGMSNPMTTAEDIVVGGASGTPARLAVGTEGQVLSVSSGSVAWADAAGGGDVSADAIWDAAGDLVVGTGANTAARLALGTSSYALISNGSTVAYKRPPGWEFDYVEKTTDTNVTATTEASGDTVITSNATTFDGEPVIAEFFCPRFQHPATSSVAIVLSLFEGATQLGRFGVILDTGATNVPFLGRYRFTPSAGSHTYVTKAHVGGGTGVIHAGSGGTSGEFPAYLRFTKV